MNRDRTDYKFLLRPRSIIIYIILFVLLISSLMVFFSFRHLAQKIDRYGKNIAETHNYVTEINNNIKQKTVKMTTAELLMNNTNKILSTIYFGTADSDTRKEAKDFTAFSLMYKENFYVITAGHCIEMDEEKYKNFKFKANNKNNFIYLRLIEYNNDYKNNIDYAIFYDPYSIRTGLYPAASEEDQTPQYVLGNIEKNLNLVKRYKDAVEGESGSPIINSRCHVVGIMIKRGGSYTPISVVLEALDRISADI